MAKETSSSNENDSTLQGIELDLHAVGVPEIDEMLKGGIPRGATVLIAGPSGAGKTMFCMQWLFEGFRQYQEPGLYISLTEPISKFLKHLKSTSFYSSEFVEGGSVKFEDLRNILDHQAEKKNREAFTSEDVWEIVDAIGNMVVESGAKRVILDSVTAICYRLESRDLIRQFIFALGTTLAYLDATVFLTSEVNGENYSIFGVEEFICDGIFNLRYQQAERDEREFRIVKLRGHGYNNYPAKYYVTPHGLKMYPHRPHKMLHKASKERVPTGIEGLDEMTAGGYTKGSSVLISGPSGSGKSIMALHFLVKSLQEGKKCLHLSLEESRAELMRNTKSFGWDIEQYEKNGQLKIITTTAEEHYLEAHFQEAERLIAEEGFEYVIVDSLSALASHYPSTDLYNVCKRFIAHNKNEGVTTVFTVAISSLIGAEQTSDIEISTLTDTIIMLRYIEIDSELHHGVMILKMRDSQHDRRMREFTFEKNGMVISSAFTGYEGIMSGSARKVSNATEEKLHSLFLEILGPQGDELFTEEQRNGITQKRIVSLAEELKSEGILDDGQYAEFMERSTDIFEG